MGDKTQMNIPKGLVKKQTKEEIEEIVRKTVVKGVIIKDIAQEIKEYLENEAIAKRIEVTFEKYIDLDKTGLEVKLAERKRTKKGMELHIEAIREEDWELLEKISKKERNKILESLRELDMDIEEEEILAGYDSSFNVISQDVIHELKLDHINFYDTKDKEVNTGETIEVGMWSKEKVPIIKVYKNPQINGTIKYAKFNMQYNKKLLKALEKNGYICSINVTSP